MMEDLLRVKIYYIKRRARRVTVKCRKLTPFQRFRAPRIPDGDGKEHFFDGSPEDATR